MGYAHRLTLLTLDNYGMLKYVVSCHYYIISFVKQLIIKYLDHLVIQYYFIVYNFLITLHYVFRLLVFPL